MSAAMLPTGTAVMVRGDFSQIPACNGQTDHIPQSGTLYRVVQVITGAFDLC